MTKHHKFIASVIQRMWQDNSMIAHAHSKGCICTRFANALEKKNPAFQRGQFLVACLPPEDACEGYSPSRKTGGTCNNCGGARSDHA